MPTIHPENSEILGRQCRKRAVRPSRSPGALGRRDAANAHKVTVVMPPANTPKYPPESLLLRLFFQLFVYNVPFMIALFLFLCGHGSRFLVRRHRYASQVILEPRRREYEHHARWLVVVALQSHPGMRGNERHSSRMQIAFLIAHLNMNYSYLTRIESRPDQDVYVSG